MVKCPKCEKKFSWENQLKRHKVGEHCLIEDSSGTEMNFDEELKFEFDGSAPKNISFNVLDMITCNFDPCFLISKRGASANVYWARIPNGSKIAIKKFAKSR